MGKNQAGRHLALCVIAGRVWLGLAMGVIGIIFELVSRKEEALPWYLILGLFLASGFVWGLAMWFVTMWSYSRATKVSMIYL